MNDEQRRVTANLDEQLIAKPLVLVLSIKDWLIYEGFIKTFANDFLSITPREDSPVPLTYKAVPVVMKTNEVKDLIKELVSRNAPVPSVEVPINSGGVKPMTKDERAMEEPEQKRKADLIESLTDDVQWWNGDQFILPPEPVAAPTPLQVNPNSHTYAPAPNPNSTAGGFTNASPSTTAPSI